MPAKLADALLAPLPRRVIDLQTGESIYVIYAALQVDEERNCYIESNAEDVGPRDWAIKVERREDGYHIQALAGQKYVAKKLSTGGLLPVASITERN